MSFICWLWLSTNICLLHNFIQKNKQDSYLKNFTVGVQNADPSLECIRLVFSAKTRKCARAILDHSSFAGRHVQSDTGIAILQVWQCLLYCKLGLPIHHSSYRLFRYRLTFRWKCAGAPSCINHICWRWCNGTSSSKFGKSFCRKRRFSSPFNLCGKKCGPIRQSPRIPTLTLNEKDSWCRACLTSLGLTAAHTWQLWKLKMPTRVNPASSENKILLKTWRSVLVSPGRKSIYCM